MMLCERCERGGASGAVNCKVGVVEGCTTMGTKPSNRKLSSTD